MSDQRLNMTREREIARAIATLDREVRTLLSGHPETAALLATKSRSPEAEREKIMAALRASTSADLAEVRARWEEAEQLRWALAASASSIVRREARRLANNPTLPEEDLVQEGWLGLLAAARRFDPDLSVRFATYARWWVRAAMTRAIDEARSVRLPCSVAERVRKLRQQIQILGARCGSHGSEAEAAERVGLEPEKAKWLLESSTLVALGVPDDDGRVFEIPDGSSPADESIAEKRSLERIAEFMRSRLPPREQAIVIQRYGLGGQQPATLAEVGRNLALSRERVRQLEESTLCVLREAFANG